ncbi:MAG TPA: winged helix-turn-helix transcriptional regulator [Methanosarcina sp.]|nr:winged helix-turn-helix transcriptional regulator [Methanosarcina sp.]
MILSDLLKERKRGLKGLNITEEFVSLPVPPLPDEVSLLARTLSRPLPMQILNQLRKKQMSAGELASDLGLRLNTLTYNLCLLEKVGLITVGQVKWSCKGREVKIYALVEQPVLLIFLENRDNGSFVLDVPENCSKNLPGQAVALLESSGEK